MRSWSAALVTCVPGLAACLVALFWVQTNRLPLTGDEPHYLIMADSLVRDADLSLENNYQRDCLSQQIYGCVEPHAFAASESRLVPYHQPGLALIVALPYAGGGVVGARVGFAVISAALATLVLFRLNAADHPDISKVAWAAFVSVPMVSGALTLYPDLVAGLITLLLALWVVQRPPSSSKPISWAAFSLIAGSLSVLNLKFLPATAVLTAWAFFEMRRSDDEGPRRFAHLIPLLALAGPVAMAVLHYSWFGSVLGVRGTSELTQSPLRALMIFLGLHIDQGHGVFVQNPILLLGVPLLVIWVRREPASALMWIALYLSLIVPNSFQMGRFGGGPAGRYGWSAGLLWLIPIYRIFSSRQARVSGVGYLSALAVAYHIALAMRWLPEPAVLQTVLDERIWARNSLFPIQLRYSLPSFYFWDFAGYLTYLPNVLAMGGLVLLACSHVDISKNVWWSSKKLWAGYALLCAILLPVAPRPEDGTPQDVMRIREATRGVRSESLLRFEAERMSPHSASTTVDDARASGGQARSNQPAPRHGLVIFGPYVDLLPGKYLAHLSLRLNRPANNGQLGVFEVTTDSGRQKLASAAVLTKDAQPTAYSTVAVTFESSVAIDGVELRFLNQTDEDILLDYVELRPLLPHPDRH